MNKKLVVSLIFLTIGSLQAAVALNDPRAMAGPRSVTPPPTDCDNPYRIVTFRTKDGRDLTEECRSPDIYQDQHNQEYYMQHIGSREWAREINDHIAYMHSLDFGQDNDSYRGDCTVPTGLALLFDTLILKTNKLITIFLIIVFSKFLIL